MKNFLFCAITILILFFLVSCTAQSNDQENTNAVTNPTYGAWQDQPEPPLAFELEQTFGDNEEIILPQSSQLAGPVTDTAGNLYVIEGQNGTMYSFDPKGNMRWETGEEGTGPGDFERPRGLVTNGEHLYTANVNGSRIDQFDFDGNLLNSTSLENIDHSLTTVEGFLSDSLLVASSTVWGNLGEKVTVFNIAEDFKIADQFEIIVAPEIDLGEGLSSGINIEIVDSLITAGNRKDYAIQFYNSRGDKVKSIKRDFNKLVRPGFYNSDGSRAIGDLGRLNAPLLLPDGYYITTLSWPTNIEDPDQYVKTLFEDRENNTRVNYKNSIDLYDADGTLLYSLEQEGQTPKIGNISYIDKKGEIYTKIDDPFPQIRRYSLTINEPDE